MTLINKLILNRDVHSELQSCAKDLEDLTKRDVNDIANGMILLKRKEASDSEAIDAFFRFYPSMDQLNAKQVRTRQLLSLESDAVTSASSWR